MVEAYPIFFEFHTENATGSKFLHGVIKLIPSVPDPNKTAYELLSIAILRKFPNGFLKPLLKRINAVRVQQLGRPIDCVRFGTDIVYFLK
jgi:hypothetical protein